MKKKQNIEKSQKQQWNISTIIKRFLCFCGIHRMRIGFGWSGIKRYDTCIDCQYSVWITNIKGRKEIDKNVIRTYKMKVKKRKYLMNIIKEALLEVKKIIDFHISRLNESDIHDLSDSERKSIQHLLQSLNVECNCDHYHGFDCGCSVRNFLFNQSNKMLIKTIFKHE